MGPVGPRESGATITQVSPFCPVLPSFCQFSASLELFPLPIPSEHQELLPHAWPGSPQAVVLPEDLTNFPGSRAEGLHFWSPFLEQASLLGPLPTWVDAGGRWPERGMAGEPPVRKSGSGNHKKRRSQAGARTTESPLPSNLVGSAATPISEGGRRWGYFLGRGQEELRCQGLCSC